MNGFERRKQKKMEDIIRTARELFTSRGISDVSISEIARKAAVSQVTIYNYFGSKEALLCAVLKNIADKGIRDFNEIIDSDIPFTEKLKKMFIYKTSALDAYNPDFIAKVMQSDVMMVKEFIEDLYTKKSLPLLIRFIEAGKKEGVIDPDLSNHSLLVYISMFMKAMGEIDLTADSSLLKDLTALCFYGICGK